ncbi:MAG: hypothetical protein ACREQZ_11350, partial [Woeseiaceae bacterium]
MSPAVSTDELSLREEVEKSERLLGGLERELRAVDGEFEELARRSRQYDLLRRAIGSLEELESLGAQHLFWDGPDGPQLAGSCLLNARRRMDAFAGEVADVERRRESILGRIGNQNEALDHLHYDLLDAIEEEESRKSEWVVERDVQPLPYRLQVMPWARGCEEDREFRRNLAASVLVCLLAVLLMRLVELPIPERAELTEVPERVAKLIREERRPPPPAPVVEPIVPEELPQPEPELAEEQPPEPSPESAEEPVVAELRQEETREKVKSKGILAFRESFASRASFRPAAQLGSQARVSSAGERAVGRPER